jgi:hypothetical protein
MLSSMSFGHVVNVLSFLEMQDIFRLCESKMCNKKYLSSILVKNKCFRFSLDLCALQSKKIDYAQVVTGDQYDKVDLFLYNYKTYGYFASDVHNYIFLIKSLLSLGVINRSKFGLFKSKFIVSALLTNFINLEIILQSIDKLRLINYMLTSKIYRFYYCFGFFDVSVLTRETFYQVSNDYEQFVVELAHREVFGPMFNFSNPIMQRLLDNFEQKNKVIEI